MREVLGGIAFPLERIHGVTMGIEPKIDTMLPAETVCRIAGNEGLTGAEDRQICSYNIGHFYGSDVSGTSLDLILFRSGQPAVEDDVIHIGLTDTRCLIEGLIDAFVLVQVNPVSNEG